MKTNYSQYGLPQPLYAIHLTHSGYNKWFACILAKETPIILSSFFIQDCLWDTICKSVILYIQHAVNIGLNAITTIYSLKDQHVICKIWTWVGMIQIIPPNHLSYTQLTYYHAVILSFLSDKLFFSSYIMLFHCVYFGPSNCHLVVQKGIVYWLTKLPNF